MGKYCCRCKCYQLVERQKYSYCNPCKQVRKKEARIQDRKEKGLPLHARGTGQRSPLCTDCYVTKEDVQQSYCNACRSKRDKAARLAAGCKPKTGLCPCGAERAPNQKRFCAPCKAEDSRKYRASLAITKEQREKERARQRDDYLQNKEARKARFIQDDVYRTKVIARNMVNRYVAKKLISVSGCEVCGVVESVEAHHDDYTKPLDIRWLCGKHHEEHHVNERLLKRRST